MEMGVEEESHKIYLTAFQPRNAPGMNAVYTFVLPRGM